MCDYEDPTKSVFVEAIIAGQDPIDGSWTTRGESRIVPLSVTADDGTSGLAGRTPQTRENIRTDVNWINSFLLGFIDREALDGAQTSNPIGALSDMFARSVIDAGLASGNGFVSRDRAVESSTYLLSASFEAAGRTLEWRSANLGGRDGPIAVLYDACHLL
jgi:hypothetical protein